MVDAHRLRHVVGGTAFLARGPLLLLIPTSLLTSLLSRGIEDMIELIGWSVANLLAFLTCWGLVALGDRGLFAARAERPVAVSLVVAFGAGLGALKGAATDVAGAALGVGELVGGAVLWRSAGTAVLGAVAVPAVAALKVTLDRYRTEHALLVAERLARLRGPGDRSFLAAGERVGLPAFIADARQMLAGIDASEAATTIVRLVDERLRPLTHALWASGDEPPAELDAGSLLRIAVLRNPFPLAAVVLPYTLSVWPTSVQVAGPLVGTARAVVAGFGLLVVIVLARTLRPARRSSSVTVLHLGLTILAATAVQIAQWDRLLGGMPEPSSVGLWVSVGTWLTLLILVGGAVSGALRDRARVREELLRVVGPDVIRAVALEGHDRLEARRVATLLHGDLQGRLIATARRIERHGDDAPAVDGELAMLDRVLAGFDVDGCVTERYSLLEQLNSLIERWSGFITLRLEMDAAARLLVDHDAERVARVVEEAVVNAVRHGLASSALIVIEVDGSGLAVAVTDDGIGPRDGRPGLGSTFFDLASGGAWALTAGQDGGTVLSMTIPA
jgi:signal transduction histidine kinase